MLPEELADIAGVVDSITGILGTEGDLNLEGVDSQQINDLLEQFTGGDGSMDIESLLGELENLQGMNP